MCTVYPTLSKFVIKQLIPFATTFLCEAGLSAMSVQKKRKEIDLMLRMACGCTYITSHQDFKHLQTICRHNVRTELIK